MQPHLRIFFRSAPDTFPSTPRAGKFRLKIPVVLIPIDGRAQPPTIAAVTPALCSMASEAIDRLLEYVLYCHELERRRVLLLQ
jgi:hypothetical protein